MTSLDYVLLAVLGVLIVVLILLRFRAKNSIKFEFAVLTALSSIILTFYVLPIRKLIFTDLFGLEIPPAPDIKIFIVSVIAVIAVYAIYALIQIFQFKFKSQIRPQTTPTTLPQSPNINTHHLPSPTTELIGRHNELKRIKDAFKRDTTSIFTLIAGGGVGKSALTYKWVQWLTQDKHLHGASKVFAWSFYSQGAHQTVNNSAPFFEAALPFFGFQGEIPSDELEKARALADLLYQQNVVLILDGFEPQQHPSHVLDGEIADGAMKELIRCIKTTGLGGSNNLLLISSRQKVIELNDYQGAVSLDLQTLSQKDGVALLNNIGCHGAEKDLNQAVSDMGGHALALVLMAKLLVKQFHGHIQQRDRLPALFTEPEKGGHALRVVQYYDREYWAKPDRYSSIVRFLHRLLNQSKQPPERALLQCLGLFDRPMGLAEKNILFKQATLAKPLKNLNDDELNTVNLHLQQAGLLLAAESPRCQWDTHPLIRSYFADSLRQSQPKLYQQAQQVLFEYYQSLPEKNQPDTLEDLQPLYRAVLHGCLAGLYKQAREQVYRDRIQRGNEGYSIFKLGAYSHDLTALLAFFAEGWQIPKHSDLSSENQAWLLAEASFCLMSLGRLAEAVSPRTVDMEMAVKQQDWQGASISARNLVDLYLPLAQLDKAKTSANKAIDYANNSEDLFAQMVSKTYLARSLHYLGLLDQALALFQQAEQIQAERNADDPQLYALQGHLYCALLLDRNSHQAQTQQVMARALYSLNMEVVQNHLLSIAFDQLTLARLPSPQHAYDFDEAVTAMQASGNVLNLPTVLLARAKHYRLQQAYPTAQTDLDHARDIIDRCGMKLYLINALLLQANLDLDQGQTPPESIMQQLHSLIPATGYKLRQPELTLLDCRLALQQQQLDTARAKRQQAWDELADMGYWGFCEDWARVARSFD